MVAHSLIALVTLAALAQYFVMSLNVGRARGRLGVAAPATSGHPEFEQGHASEPHGFLSHLVRQFHETAR